MTNTEEFIGELYSFAVDCGWSSDGKPQSGSQLIENARLTIAKKDKLINLLIKALYDWEATEGSVHTEPQTGLDIFKLISELGIKWTGDLSAEQYIQQFSKEIEDNKENPSYNIWQAHRAGR